MACGPAAGSEDDEPPPQPATSANVVTAKITRVVTGVALLERVGLLVKFKKAWTGPFLGKLVVRISEPAFVQREAAAADALSEPIAQRGEAGDPVVEAALPAIR